ncbi:hypothetical protein [Treponema pedis]|uniref:hypothetical protein n=1 Tax=Treponema pedis TaxID=409322 RepID=UPI000463AB4F|nr:hypothetical protein [Treponema pedis]
MRRFLPFILYAAGLACETARAVLSAYSQKSFSPVFSLFDFTGLALICLPAVFFFMLLSNEKEFHSLLKIIALIKFFCIIAAYLFLIKTSAMIGSDSVKMGTFRFQFILTWIFLPIDTFILVFSLLRERSLCK